MPIKVRCSGLLGTIGLFFWIVAGAVQAQTLSDSLLFNVEPQSLERALLQFSEQSGVQLVIATESVSGKQSRGIRGRYRIGDALTFLLQGTNIEFIFTSASTVFVRQKAGGQAQTNDETLGENQTTETVIGNRAQSLNQGSTDPQEVYGGVLPLEETVEQSFIDEIIVTGSRLIRDGASTNMPVTVIGRSEIEATGQTNIADVINSLPSVSPGFSPQNSQRQTSGGAGLNLLDLRGLSFERTLVLVNGRRHVGARRGTTAVDLNTIPSAIIERVEIATGGTSAIYGADAVSGVVNIILRDRFSGLQIDAQAGISGRGDAESGQVSILAGTNFSENRGNIFANFSYDKTSGVSALDRVYASDGLDRIANPENAADTNGRIPNFVHRRNIRFNSFSDQGHFDLGGERYIFEEDGKSIRLFDFGEIGDQTGSQIGGDGAFFERFDNLLIPTERYILTNDLHYVFNRHLKISLSGKYAKTKTSVFWQPVEDPVADGFLPLRIDNPFLPADLIALMEQEGVDTIEVARIHNEFGRRGTKNDRDTFQVAGTIEGTIQNGLNYHFYGTYGRTEDNILSLNSRDTDRFFESIDAIRDDTTGKIICRSPEARTMGCVPLNISGIGNASEAAINYSRINLRGREVLSQFTTGGLLQGTLFDFGTGDILFDAGFEYRKELSSRQSNSLQAEGRTFLPRIPSVHGTYNVSEIYGETRIPLLGETLISEHLAIEGAVRLSDYNTTGIETAWHAILDYAATPDFRLRVVRSKSVRAPNINELFSPETEGFFFVTDLCDMVFQSASDRRAINCAALGLAPDFNARNNVTKKVLLGGDPDLRPETSNSWTIGAVVTPRLLPSLTITVDYWRIDIADAITNFDVDSVLENCVEFDIAVSENEFCRLIERDPDTGVISSILATESNTGLLEARGIDFELNYSSELSRLWQKALGRLSFTLTGTLLNKLRFFNNAEDRTNVVKMDGILPHPKLQFLLRATYETGPFSFTWRTRYIGSSRIEFFPNIPADQFDLPKTGVEQYHDLSIKYNITDRTGIRLNINNIFDNKPPRRGFLIKQGNNNAAIYPNLGTQIFLGFTLAL